MIAADASWLIALLDPDDVHHQRATEIRQAIDGEQVILHPLTLAECLVGPARLGLVDDADTKIRAAIEVVDVDPDSPARLAQIRADRRLRLPDAVVLDTAQQHGAGIATVDGPLADAAQALGLRVFGLTTDG